MGTAKKKRNGRKGASPATPEKRLKLAKLREKMRREHERARKRIERNKDRLIQKLQAENERMRVEQAEWTRWTSALADINKWEMLHRDVTKANHKSILRHLPQEEFLRVMRQIGDSFGTPGEMFAFRDVAMAFGVSVQEVFTLFYSP